MTSSAGGTEATDVRIPTTWYQRTLSEVCSQVEKVDPQDLGRSQFKYVDISSIDSATNRVLKPQHLPTTQAPSRARQLIRNGDIVFSTVRPYLLNIASIDSTLDGEIASTGFCVIRPNPSVILPELVHFFVISDHLLGQVLPLQRGVSYPAVRDKEVLGAFIVVPPLSEQRVIVDVLEGQFVLLDAVLESVRRSRVEAVRLRRALLRDAFSGVLTNPDLGPGELPAGWSRRQLVAVSELIRGVTYKKSQAVDHPADGFVPLVRATNIEVDHLLLNEFVYVPASVVREDQYLRSGDIVLAVSSGSSSVVGKSAMVREIGATTFGAFCGVLRPSAELLADFLRFVVQSPGIREMWSEAARGTNINNLKRDQIISTEIVIPPLAEQHEIVELLERELGLLDLAMKAADRIEMEAKSFRRSLLHSAFNGELTREWRESHG